MIKTQILTKNNQDTIEDTLESINGLDSKIIIVDLGSTDETLNICKKYNLEIIEIKEKNDYSKIRNELSGDLNFYINPWEVLLSGKDIINSIKETTKIHIFNNNIISKDIRIWQKEKFKNPIYETIINKNSKLNSNIIIKSNNKFNYYENELKILNTWLVRNPFDLDVYYYTSFYYLSKNNFDKFLFYCNEYFSRCKKIDYSYISLKYYSSMIKLYTNKIKESAKDAIMCVVKNPSYSEFWCLLGDIYYKQKKWSKSKSFYENALIMGKKRDLKDEFLIDLDKYKKHPSNMINIINGIINKTEYF